MNKWLSLFVLSCLFAWGENPTPPFVLMTVPKSGSHLIIKALHLLTGSSPIWHTRFPSLFYVPIEKGFLYTHLAISPGLMQNYAELPDLRKIVFVRDLRDVAISMIQQIRKNPWPGLTGAERDAFLQMSFDDQLFFVIEREYELEEVEATAPTDLQVSLVHIAEQAVRLQADPRTLVCRYENLVGPLGGGDVVQQIDELERIARYLRLDMPTPVFQEIAEQLYGNEYNPFGKGPLRNFQSTFNRGQIGQWKEHFKEEHKIAFKKKLGEKLIALGYEQDDQW